MMSDLILKIIDLKYYDIVVIKYSIEVKDLVTTNGNIPKNILKSYTTCQMIINLCST